MINNETPTISHRKKLDIESRSRLEANKSLFFMTELSVDLKRGINVLYFHELKLSDKGSQSQLFSHSSKVFSEELLSSQLRRQA